MSNFRSKAFNPASKRVEDAEYCDDYYGRHRYGIRFDDGCVHPEAQCGIDAAATQLDSLQARVKELEAECFRLAADTCHAGYGDEYGHHRCREVDEANARATRLQQERDEAYKRATSRDALAAAYVAFESVDGRGLEAKLHSAIVAALAFGPENT